MLELILNEEELFDERTNKFVYREPCTLVLEHSLLSLSKWESFYNKPFLSTSEKTDAETYKYVEFMILEKTAEVNVQESFGRSEIVKVRDYIASSQTATTFGEMPKRPGRGETITSELIYYWMVSFGIPFECETWHLNRLFSLIRICNIKNSKPDKQSKAETARRNHELNARRKAELGTSG